MQLAGQLFEFLINRPLLMMAAMGLPLLAAWLLRRSFPSQRLLLLMLLPLLMSLFTVKYPGIVWQVVLLNALILLVACIDIFTVAAASSFEATRSLQKIVSIGKKSRVELQVSNLSGNSSRIEIRDDLPDGFHTPTERFEYMLGPQSRASFEYEFTGNRRGRFELSYVYLRVRSRLGLWLAYLRLPVKSELFVYPDMAQIGQYAILARTNRLNLMGVRRSRKIGQDNEFERLRDYTQDDNFKHIDWRTTARRRKLTVRDFQSNQSQRIVFMVDCGRMMTGLSADQNGNEISMLDHALNAMLMLSYVALRQGDSVGLVCFSNAIHNYTPPRTGVRHINRLLHAAFDQHASFVESRYDQAFFHLRANCPKRSLVVLITNVIDQINAHQIFQYLSALGGRHLPMAALLRDHQLFSAIDDFVDRNETESRSGLQPAGFHEAAVAAQIANWRAQTITDLKHHGVLTLDVFPEQLTARLVNAYLEIKAKHLL